MTVLQLVVGALLFLVCTHVYTHAEIISHLSCIQLSQIKMCLGGVEAGSHFAVELERCLDAFLAPESGGSGGRSSALVGMERSLTHLALQSLELLTKVCPCRVT